MSLHLDFCTAKAARFAVEHWHYSQKMPVGKSVKVGVWEDGIFKGVVIFSQGNNLHIGDFLGLQMTEICELTRVALRDHVTPVTRIVKIALIFLKKHCPKMRAVISYADPEQGHLGKIYQAGNWTYIGRSASTTMMILPNGKEVHNRTAFPGGMQFGRRVKKIPRIDEATKRKALPKYKYAMGLDNNTANKIKALCQPVPK